MDKLKEINKEDALYVNENDKVMLKEFIEDNKDLLNKDPYAFIARAYDKFHWTWSNAFEYLKMILKENDVDWLPYEVRVGDTVEIVAPGQRYTTYNGFFKENDLEKYLDKYKETYNYDKLLNKLAKVEFIANHDGNLNSPLVYMLILKEDPDRVLLFGRAGFIKR